MQVIANFPIESESEACNLAKMADTRIRVIHANCPGEEVMGKTRLTEKLNHA